MRVIALAAPAVLLLAVLAGYGVAFFALRPVEAMRRRAQASPPATRGSALPCRARDELAALGRTLNDMIERLEHALERERTLIADASHELRTPLAIAQAEVELALRPHTPRHELEAALPSIGEEVQRLVRLCDDLLTLARADRRALRLGRRRISLPDLLEDFGERARRTYGDTLEIVSDEAPAVDLEADPLRIEQALSNLVANASRYGASRVRIWCSIEDGGVRLHVSDDGPGFAMPSCRGRSAASRAAPALRSAAPASDLRRRRDRARPRRRSRRAKRRGRGRRRVDTTARRRAHAGRGATGVSASHRGLVGRS